jgi:hypothetical protein
LLSPAARRITSDSSLILTPLTWWLRHQVSILDPELQRLMC